VVSHSGACRSAFGASLPALGLSNKAVYADEAESEPPVDASGGSGYTEGPDFAPNSAPSAVAGGVPARALLHMGLEKSLAAVG
jgi:hypothetical protein